MLSNICVATLVVYLLGCSQNASGRESQQDILRKELLVLTVATEESDGYLRFVRSMKKYGLNHRALGMGKEWRGGDIARYPGGGFKVNLLKEALEEYKNRSDLVILVSDSYDVIFTDGASSILKIFARCHCQVMFSAEAFCWPDDSLADEYPPVRSSEKRFLNSGGFIGFAEDLYELATLTPIQDEDDDQLYYTKIFLEEFTRAKRESELRNDREHLYTSASASEGTATSSSAMRIKLDIRSELFQNLNGAMNDLSLKFKGATSNLYNHITGNTPIVVHGNGPIKVEFNRLANYLAGQWSPTHGCSACVEGKLSLGKLAKEKYPTVFVAVIMEKATPFLPVFFDRLSSLVYPKSKMDLFIFNESPYNKKATDLFANTAEGQYRSVKYIDGSMNVRDARNLAIKDCLRMNCEYYFSVDSEAQLTNPLALNLLIEQNRSIISPLLKRPGRSWSTFWGEISVDGYYARSDDYMDIVDGKKVGLWNVPYVSNVMLIHGSHMKKLRPNPYTTEKPWDSEISFCANLRSQGMFMLVDNQHNYGHLINADEFDLSRASPEMYELFNNRIEWEMKYLHPDYRRILEDDYKLEEPCTDVYWYPLVSDAFCDDLVTMMEAFGKWSNGQNEDTRLQGGYENVPTRDIHMNQVGFEPHWLQILQDYVKPVQLKGYVGYHSDLKAIMNFVVRYRPDEQPSLRPHHDSSTFTVNLALNSRNVDYEGGGVRFLRYNCTLLDLRKGWTLMHPGRLTHYHEGLTTLSGTRYIMVSFINP